MSEREIIWSKQVQPGLWVAVEDSLNILLVVTAIDDGLKHSSDVLGNVDALKDALDLARVQVATSESGADADGLHERRMQAVRERSPAVQDGPYAYIHEDQHMA